MDTEVTKEFVISNILDMCDEPMSTQDIITENANFRGERTIRNYVSELLEEGKLFFAFRKGNTPHYVNYPPSEAERQTGKFVRHLKAKDNRGKLFRVDSALTGEGMTSFRTLHINLAHDTVVGDLTPAPVFQLLESWMITHAGINFLQERALLTPGKSLQILETIALKIRVVDQIVKQVMSDPNIHDLEKFVSEYRIGELLGNDIRILDQAWRVLIRARLIAGNPDAITDIIDEDNE